MKREKFSTTKFLKYNHIFNWRNISMSRARARAVRIAHLILTRRIISHSSCLIEISLRDTRVASSVNSVSRACRSSFRRSSGAFALRRGSMLIKIRRDRSQTSSNVLSKGGGCSHAPGVFVQTCTIAMCNRRIAAAQETFRGRICGFLRMPHSLPSHSLDSSALEDAL